MPSLGPQTFQRVDWSTYFLLARRLHAASVQYVFMYLLTQPWMSDVQTAYGSQLHRKQLKGTMASGQLLWRGLSLYSTCNMCLLNSLQMFLLKFVQYQVQKTRSSACVRFITFVYSKLLSKEQTVKLIFCLFRDVPWFIWILSSHKVCI